jgi:signal transduction histidine kinase
VNATATLGKPATDADECRRLAELLNLDAVGVVRADDGRRRVAWWAAPGTEVVPLDRILEGRASGWIAFPRGTDLVFAHLSDGAPGRSVATLSAMLGSLAGAMPDEGVELGGVAPEDPIERERTRLAYAIHDGLTQVVTASVLELEWHARRTDLAEGEAAEALNAAAAELRKALDEIRAVLASLSSQGAPAAQSLEELIQGVMERWQLPATWSIEGDLQAVSNRILDVASSVIRESVANAVKHGGSNDISVRVRVARGALEVRVEDEGRGFQPSGTSIDAGHLGLEMMRRRVAEMNGTLEIRSSPGKGTRVVARLPVQDKG